MIPPSDRRILGVLLLVALFWFIAGLAWGLTLAKAEGVGQAVAVEQPAVVVPPDAAPLELTDALAVARAYWGIPTPPGCLSTLVEVVPLPPDRAGEATMPINGWVGPCVMRVVPELSSWHLCVVVVHEYGHWLGLDHNPDPASPMFIGGPYYAAIPQCEDRRTDA